MFRIHLRDIPAEGREFHYSRSSGELNSDLNDVLGETSAYDVHFRLRPIGGAYEISGEFTGQGSLICSTCGWDLPWPLRKNFHEFLVEEAKDPHAQQGSHGSESLNLESGDEGYSTYKGDHFDAGQYFHEMVALAEPFYPECGITDCERKVEAQAKLDQLQQEARAFELKKESPFAVLQRLEVDQTRKN